MTLFTARPSRSRRSRVAFRTLSVLTVLLLTATAIVTVDLARVASASSGRLLPGTMLGGVEVGGLLPDEARSRAKAALAPALERTVTITFDGGSWTRSAAQLGATTDLDVQLGAAITAAEVGWLDRAQHRYLRRLPTSEFPVTVSEPRAEALRSWVRDLAYDLDQDAVDAAVHYDARSLTIRPHEPGLEVDQFDAEIALAAAFRRSTPATSATVVLPVDRIAPEVTTEAFAQILYLDQSEHRLDLYLDGRRARSYVVTTGTGRYPTPTGEYEITLKRPNPTWVNPAPNGWGRGMPRSIGPGPNNPLGLRALNWSVGAIRFHGTADVNNLGRDASHGCVRLSNRDIVELYELVDVGATIISVR